MFKTHSEEKIRHELSQLRPLKYNQFRWWRRWESKNEPLHKYCPLIDKIQNGDFDFSHYFWQTQYCDIEMNIKYSKSKNYQSWLDDIQLDKARRNHLWEDFIRDENEKLNEIKQLFCRDFGLSEEDYYIKIENFDGTLEDFYHYLNEDRIQNQQRVYNLR